MLIIIGLMLSGMLCGFLLKNYRITWISHLINVLIWVLLFLLGVEVGLDERIVNGLLSLGVDAIVISSLCTLGSCAAAWILWKWAKK